MKKSEVVALAILVISLTASMKSTDLPPDSFFMSEGEPQALIIIGESATASDVISATYYATKIGNMASREEEKEFSAIYSDRAENIPLSYQIPSFEVTIPVQTYNVAGGPLESTISYYKTWGVTTSWTPEDNAYVLSDGNGKYKYFDGVRIAYTLKSLWFYDDFENCVYGNANGLFDPWETHEEIQVRFDDLYADEFRKTAKHFNNHIPDLFGGDISPTDAISLVWYDGRVVKTPRIPGLIYRVDNIREPPQMVVDGVYLDEQGTHQTDLHYYVVKTFKIPHPYFVLNGLLPKFYFFGKEYTMISGRPFVTGNPHFYEEVYLYIDEIAEFDGYQVTLLDVDLDHNKAHLKIVDVRGKMYDFWMILDPMHGFSPMLQKQASTGSTIEETGLSNKDVFTLTSGGANSFVIDGIATFVGANGTIGILVNLYTLSEIESFSNKLCCNPFSTSPNNYSLYIYSERADLPNSVIDANAFLEIVPHLRNSTGYFDDVDDDSYIDYVFEVNVALCDILEVRDFLDGPNNYFKILMYDPTWDDDSDGIKDTEFDDGIDFEILQEKIYSYQRILKIDIEESELIKFDVDVTEEDKKMNLILIGNSKNNLLIRELLELDIKPDDSSDVNWMDFIKDSEFYTNPYGTGGDVLLVSNP
ncbi:MAG: S-layer protein [Candidatus Methanofastidiosia archaeon]